MVKKSLLAFTIVLFLVACSGGNIKGVWEDDYGVQVEITEDSMIFLDEIFPITLGLEHVSGDKYEISLLGETEEIELVADGDRLILKDGDDEEVLTRVEE